MIRPLLPLLALGASLTLGLHAEAPALRPGQAPHSANPILPGYFADPSVVTYEGRYYLFATLDPWGGETLGCWSSPDFVNWEYHTLNWPTKAACMTAQSSGAMVWAPSVIQAKDGSFVMYVSVGSEVYVGKAAHPLGPWENPLGQRPLIPDGFRPGYHMIDAEAFIDDDGQAWLYWGSGHNWVNGRCWLVPLAPDMVTFAGEVRDVTPANYFEGPVVSKHDGRYYLMYSAGRTTEDSYQVHYAVGDSPQGPFAEAANSPILVTDKAQNVISPGHHAAVTLAGQPYILYHRHSVPFDGNVLRQTCLDAMPFDAKGQIANVTPTHTGPGLAAKRLTSAWEISYRGSSVRSGDYRAAFVGDDNYATLWQPAGNDQIAWLQADLGTEREVATQELRLEFPWKPYRFVIEASLDGEEWKLVKSYLEAPAQGSPVRIHVPVKARYLRLRFASPSAGIGTPGVFEWVVR